MDITLSVSAMQTVIMFPKFSYDYLEIALMAQVGGFKHAVLRPARIPSCSDREL
jgi:hypothetical protein